MRNVGSSVETVFSTLRRLGHSFARHHIIVLENDSTDQTKEHLNAACEGKDDAWCFEVSIPGVGNTLLNQYNFKDRVKKLTIVRQALLKQVRTFVDLEPDKSAWDHLMLFDGDLFFNSSVGFHPSMVYSLLGLPSPGNKKAIFAEAPWDAVCANQIANWPTPGRYRDTFALRLTRWPFNKTEKRLWREPKTALHYTGNRLVPVLSCFSGLALYSMKAIVSSGCNYHYQGENECEHVGFHKCLAKHGHGKFGIYPLLTNMVNDRGVGNSTCAQVK